MSENKPPLEEIYKSVGESENLRKLIDYFRERYFVDHDSFAQWWYNPNNKRLQKSPDEFCKEGRQKELEQILLDAFLGSGGG